MDLNSHGDQILTNILDNFELSLKHGADGLYFYNFFRYVFFLVIIRFRATSNVILLFRRTEDKNPEKCKAMAKRICKIEHDYFLERDAIKEAAKQPSIESFDSVSMH